MKDWRLTGQETYLAKVKLAKFSFRADGEYDHDHCDFCWSKFSEDEGDLHVGYTTLDGCHIICEACFSDFQNYFQWKVIEGFPTSL